MQITFNPATTSWGKNDPKPTLNVYCAKTFRANVLNFCDFQDVPILYANINSKLYFSSPEGATNRL
jgi:hypothetical protein